MVLIFFSDFLETAVTALCFRPFHKMFFLPKIRPERRAFTKKQHLPELFVL